MPQWLGLLGSIILIDLVLSGDNALVIGTVASDLPRKQRWAAIALGGLGAILLRIGLAIVATFLLQLPLLQAIGGVVLLYIAVRLLLDRKRKDVSKGIVGERSMSAAKGSFFKAMLVILTADVTMSLDNVLAIGALANGQYAILAVGLFASIMLLLLGSALVSELIDHLPWLLDIACLVLAWTGGKMLLDDLSLGRLLIKLPWAELVVPIAALVFMIATDIFITWRNHQHQQSL